MKFPKLSWELLAGAAGLALLLGKKSPLAGKRVTMPKKTNKGTGTGAGDAIGMAIDRGTKAVDTVTKDATAADKLVGSIAKITDEYFG
jgi:hypothetical protein